MGFDQADFVTANSEATLDLARRYGRSDAVLLLNGCDPERFITESSAAGPITVGYVGKIGKRLDLELISACASANPDVQFIFAGPILDDGYRRPLRELANVRLLGDVHYERVPDLLTSFDVGWVPHNVGEGEVGGDVIKTYEYRAAGLPVLSTPVLGAGRRGLEGVSYLPAGEHSEKIRSWAMSGPRVERVVRDLPREVSWSGKARQILGLLGIE
ncbi:glycosyltransferase [Gordonia alkanivorans]|uniref:glycosyltransferase n=1 Tax=Gordonia alkanivorans TaxID=84096 RepID=UPI00244A12F6|nr:glycosyltransferase [Gordonia alkanivorans]MDH3009320.1 glycosyltransferase [Gordonia alkanivorans]